jgi:hypothetical protein
MNQIWRTSSFSGAEGNCLAARHTQKGVGVRDTKDLTIPALLISPEAWTAFIASEPLRK